MVLETAAREASSDEIPRHAILNMKSLDLMANDQDLSIDESFTRPVQKSTNQFTHKYPQKPTVPIIRASHLHRLLSPSFSSVGSLISISIFLPLLKIYKFISPPTGFGLPMAEGPASPCGGGSHESGGDLSPRSSNVREQDRFLPIANISRIMKKGLPANGKMSKDAKDTVQECVSEFISFVTSEASDKCQREKRKTINGDDLLWAMATLGFEDYIEPLKLYLSRYREVAFVTNIFDGGELSSLYLYSLLVGNGWGGRLGNRSKWGDTKGSAKGQEGLARKDGMLPDHSAQLAHQGSYLQGLDYGNPQASYDAFKNLKKLARNFLL
ncbi:hypothetical protein SSX86_023626 [Deinandra increscens subsp. villosa]|uniref:Transcription factor CBF/NF-Y/archaeal histone domain-containing protein n=1 Tax=Deinandra increscens subsp. villosa TaxID=3103831 RepID=A0AAP0GQ15_9ASTR